MSMKIVEYSFKWQIKENKGSVYLKREDGLQGEVTIDSIEEFQALSYILQNSKDVFFDEAADSINMGWTATGT